MLCRVPGIGGFKVRLGVAFYVVLPGLSGFDQGCVLTVLYRYSTRMEKFVKDRLDLCML